MGLLGLAMVTGFFLTIAFSIHENSKTIAVQGLVTGTSSQTSTSDRTYITYRHAFEYVDKDGIARTGRDNSDRQSEYSAGTTVSIGYYPDTPSRVRIHPWFGLWKLQMVLLGLGSVLIWYMFAAIKQVKAGVLLQSNEQ